MSYTSFFTQNQFYRLICLFVLFLVIVRCGGDGGLSLKETLSFTGVEYNITPRSLGYLEEWDFLERQSFLDATPTIFPIEGRVTSGFGYRTSTHSSKPSFHQGLDIAGSHGTLIRATGSGYVTEAGYNAGYGRLVSINHGYGFLTRYGHISKIFVVIGQYVRKGDIIATVGNTGRSTGPHVHYEVHLNNTPIDPMYYILEDAL